MCRIYEIAQPIWKMIAGTHFLYVNSHANKLEALFNLILKKKRYWRRVLPPIAYKEGKWLHLLSFCLLRDCDEKPIEA
jgi:hypothetical protein